MTGHTTTRAGSGSRAGLGERTRSAETASQRNSSVARRAMVESSSPAMTEASVAMEVDGVDMLAFGFVSAAASAEE